MNNTLGQSPCTVLDQHKTNSVMVFIILVGGVLFHSVMAFLFVSLFYLYIAYLIFISVVLCMGESKITWLGCYGGSG